MIIVCVPCAGTGVVDGAPCIVCGGDGQADPFDSLGGITSNELVNCFDILNDKIDILQADITAIKAKTDNMPNDISNVLSDIHEHVE